MNKNSDKFEKEFFQIWKKAENNLHNQQQLNKETMETLLSKTSSDFTISMLRLLKADAIFKLTLLLGLIGVAAFNLANLFVMGTVLFSIILGTSILRQERKLVEGLRELQDRKGTIRNFLEKDIHFFRNNILRIPLVLSISIFLFYILGSLIYHGIKYDTIRPVEDLQDALVLLAFLIFATIVSFAAYYPLLQSRINYLKSLLEDFHDNTLIQEHLDKQSRRKRKMILATSMMIILGILILIILIIAIR